MRRRDIWLLLLALVLLFFAVWSWAEWYALERLLDHGVIVPAQNISTTIDVSRRYPVNVIRYDFQLADGSPGSAGVERFRGGRWRDLEPSEFPGKFYQGVLQVRYLPEDPQVHRLDVGLPRRLSRARRSALLLLTGAAVVGMMGGVLLFRRLAL